MAAIGTGYGYITVRFSPGVGASGHVYDEEIDNALVRKLSTRVEAEKPQNSQPVLGKPDNPGLPGSVLDAAILADACH